MKKIALLLSGHLRNMGDIVDNFKNNIVDTLQSCDIYVHTWDNNHTYDKLMCNDKFFDNETVDVEGLFNRNKIYVKKLLIENQKEFEDKISLKEYLKINTKSKTFHGKDQSTYVKEMVRKLFLQFYGHYKVFKLIDTNVKYSHIIKTRPDSLYDKFDMDLLKYKLFFPRSHRMGGSSINNAFFGGEFIHASQVLSFFNNVIYNEKKMNEDIINKYHKSDVNFNKIFNYYVIKHLKFNPKFVSYNPKIYRDKNNIVTIK